MKKLFTIEKFNVDGKSIERLIPTFVGRDINHAKVKALVNNLETSGIILINNANSFARVEFVEKNETKDIIHVLGFYGSSIEHKKGVYSSTLGIEIVFLNIKSSKPVVRKEPQNIIPTYKNDGNDYMRENNFAAPLY
jgi:hypothetical protein